MSILLASTAKDYVAVCTDCQHTNTNTGIPGYFPYDKIDKMPDGILIAHGGNLYITQTCMIYIRKLHENGAIVQGSVEETANAVMRVYENQINENPELEKKNSSIFIVAGKLESNHFGFIIVNNTKDGITSTVVDGEITPTTNVFAPVDMDTKVCIGIVNEVARNTELLHGSTAEYIETVLRKSVERVSMLSSYVSAESLFYICIKEDVC